MGARKPHVTLHRGTSQYDVKHIRADVFGVFFLLHVKANGLRAFYLLVASLLLILFSFTCVFRLLVYISIFFQLLVHCV